MTREIPLSQGLVALVDDADLNLVMSRGKWHAAASRTTHYAHRNVRVGSRRTTELMHTFLTGWSLVDHRNGNGLDNRRSNLRQATNTENARNAKRGKNNTSGFKGVTSHLAPRGLRWRARITVDRTTIHLGVFDTAEAAARAYDTAALERFGEFAHLNFPQGAIR